MFIYIYITLMHAIANRGCTNTVRVCTGSWLWEKNPLVYKGVKPSSAACWTWWVYPLSKIPTPLRFSICTVLILYCTSLGRPHNTKPATHTKVSKRNKAPPGVHRYSSPREPIQKKWHRNTRGWLRTGDSCKRESRCAAKLAGLPGV